jgi:hypothetical protein
MTVGEIIDVLINSEVPEYHHKRLNISEEFIEMIMEIFPDEYSKIRNKEEEFQNILRILNEINNSDSNN